MERKSKKPTMERKFKNAVESQFRTINLSADRSAIMTMQLERKSDFQVGAQYVAQLKKKPNGAQVQKRGRSAIPNKKSEHNSIFLSEKSAMDRDFSLAYFMRENKCFPPGAEIKKILEFYFQVR